MVSFIKKQALLLLIASFTLLVSCQEDQVEKEVTVEEGQELVQDPMGFLQREWFEFNSELFDVEINEDIVVLSLKSNAAWFNGEQGGFFYTEVEGDFEFSATVEAGQMNDITEPISQNYSFGGLMVRNPANTSQNYVHVVTGTGDALTDPVSAYEWKNTVASSSEFEIFPSSTSSHDFRMVRSGNTIELYRRDTNSDGIWERITTQELNLEGVTGEELQVGFNIYTAFEGALVPLKVRVSNISLTEN